jgi:Recombination endonuclease VII
MKTCNKCNIARALTEFKADPRNKDGLQGICKICNRLWNKKRREERRSGIGLIPITEKQCNSCGKTKPTSMFYKDLGIADGHATLCKSCRDVAMRKWREEHREEYNKYMREFRAGNKDWAKDTDLKRTYGIGLEDYKRMLEEQGHVCKLCKKPPQGKRPLVVDHNHETGEIRGLLCYGCNRKIVILDKSIEEREAAIAYVKGKSII